MLLDLSLDLTDDIGGDDSIVNVIIAFWFLYLIKTVPNTMMQEILWFVFDYLISMNNNLSLACTSLFVMV